MIDAWQSIWSVYISKTSPKQVVMIFSCVLTRNYRNLLRLSQPLETLTAYISFARDRIHPELTTAASDLLVATYVSMRGAGYDPRTSDRRITATTRQLESMCVQSFSPLQGLTGWVGSVYLRRTLACDIAQRSRSRMSRFD